MLRKVKLAIIAVALASVPLGAQTVDAQLDKGRQYLKARQFRQAVEVLEAALPNTASLPPHLQAQAETALHFYAAVAHSALNNESEALGHLVEVFRLSPEIRSVDPRTYDKAFVDLFARARYEFAGSGHFSDLYPSYSGDTQQQLLVEVEDPALELLGTKAEKRAWRESGSTSARERVMEMFWEARDPDPSTAANEFRDTFERRVAFADATFGDLGQRGTFSDRGRVFVLLGEPAFVRRRALNRGDNVESFNVGSIGIDVGTIEYWVYGRDQIPTRGAKPTVTYRFVTHQGIGDHVLQKDGIAMNVLAGIPGALVRR